METGRGRKTRLATFKNSKVLTPLSIVDIEHTRATSRYVIKEQLSAMLLLKAVALEPIKSSDKDEVLLSHIEQNVCFVRLKHQTDK